MPAWPAVYRLKNGKYVEASRDFPSFYISEVLPQLNQQIHEAEARISREPFQQETVAVLEMEKNKILRVLGRDSSAGLQQAYEWMYSDDTQVLQCAIATFADIGGHETELRIARQALPAAELHQMESHKGG
jgi:DNA-directed RNA polymerase specialized sigma subunit